MNILRTSQVLQYRGWFVVNRGGFVVHLSPEGRGPAPPPPLDKDYSSAENFTLLSSFCGVTDVPVANSFYFLLEIAYPFWSTMYVIGSEILYIY